MLLSKESRHEHMATRHQSWALFVRVRRGDEVEMVVENHLDARGSATGVPFMSLRPMAVFSRLR